MITIWCHQVAVCLINSWYWFSFFGFYCHSIDFSFLSLSIALSSSSYFTSSIVNKVQNVVKNIKNKHLVSLVSWSAQCTTWQLYSIICTLIIASLPFFIKRSYETNGFMLERPEHVFALSRMLLFGFTEATGSVRERCDTFGDLQPPTCAWDPPTNWTWYSFCCFHCNIVEQGSLSTVVWKHVFERGFSKSQLERKQAL